MSAPLICADFSVPGIADADDSTSWNPNSTSLRIRVSSSQGKFVIAELVKGSASAAATVSWGDGQTSTVTFNNQNKCLGLTHYYNEPGWYIVTLSDAFSSVRFVDSSSVGDPIPSGSYYWWPPYGYETDMSSMIRDVLSVAPGLSSFSEGCFENCRMMSPSVYSRISHSMTFGPRAFSRCYGLVSVLRPENSPSITPGAGAFSYCRSLVSLDGLHGLTTCPDECFRGCLSLNVGAPPSGWITRHNGSLGSKCFADCTSMTGTGVLTGGYVRTLGSYLFAGCTSLADVTGYANAVASSGTLWTNRKYIPEGMFDGCTSLASLAGFAGTGTSPGFVSIGARCFRNCTGLTSFNFPDSGGTLVSVGDEAFDGCTSLASLAASPQHVESFGKKCFRGCISLTSLDGISPEVESLGDGCFSGCSVDTFDSAGRLVSRAGLSDVSALEDCTGLERLPERCFDGCKALTEDDLIALSQQVGVAGAACFRNCVSMSIAPNIRSDGATSLFEGCYDTYKVRDEGESTDTTVFSGIVDASDVMFSTKFPAAAFRNCRFLMKAPPVSMSVTQIGDECFRGCRNLSTLTASGDGAISFGTRCFAECAWNEQGGDDPNPLKIVAQGTPGTRYSGDQSVLPAAVSEITGLEDLGGIGTRLELWFLKSLTDGSLFGTVQNGTIQNVVERMFPVALDILGDDVRYTRDYHSLNVLFSSICGNYAKSTLDSVSRMYVKDLHGSLTGTSQTGDFHTVGSFHVSGCSGLLSTESYVSGKLRGTINLFALTTNVSGYSSLTSHLKHDVAFELGSGGSADVSESFDYTRTEGGSRVTDSSKVTVKVIGVSTLDNEVDVRIDWSYKRNGIDTAIVSWTVSVSDMYRCDSDEYDTLGPTGVVAMCFRVLILAGLAKNSEDFDGGSYYVSMAEMQSFLDDVFEAEEFQEELLAELNRSNVFPRDMDGTYGKYCFEGSSGFGFQRSYWLPGMTRVPDGLVKGTATVSTLPFRGCTSFGRYVFADTGIEDIEYWPSGLTEITDGLFSGCSDLGSMYGIPNTVTYLGESCFSGSGLMQLDHFLTAADDQTLLGTNGLKDDAFRSQLCTTIPERAFAGTVIEELTYDVSNTLDPDDTVSFGSKIFNNWCKITVDVIHTGGHVYDTRPVLKIRPNRTYPANDREILVSVSYSDVDSTTDGIDFAGNTVSGCLDNLSFGVYTSSSKTVTNYENVGGQWRSRDRYYVRMASSTRHFYGYSYDEMVRLSYVSSGASGVVFTCGPYQFTVRFWIKATVTTDPQSQRRYATAYQVLGAAITNVSVRSGYDAAAHTLPYFPLVTSVGPGAFADCDALDEVWWPTSQNYISDDAFRGCGNLEDLSSLPANVVSFGQRSFAGCPFGSLPHIIRPITFVTTFTAMAQYKSDKDLVAADIKSDVDFYSAYNGDFVYSSNRQIRFIPHGASGSSMQSGFMMGWGRGVTLYDGETFKGYTIQLNSFSTSSGYDRVPNVTAENVTAPLVFSECPSPDYGTGAHGTGTYSHSIRASFNGSLYNLVLKFTPEYSSSQSTTFHANFDRVEFSTDDRYEEMKKIRHAIGLMRADRSSPTGFTFNLKSSELVDANGNEIQWATARFITTTGEWNNLTNVRSSVLGYVSGTQIRVGYPTLLPADASGHRYVLEFYCSGSYGTWYVKSAFTSERVIIRSHALEIPSSITSIGRDCFSFDEYEDATVKIGNLTFLNRSVSDIQGMASFPWGVPDGCTITDSSGNIAYYKEPADG